MSDGPQYQLIRVTEVWESVSGTAQGIPIQYERGKRIGEQLRALALDRWEPVAIERDGDGYVILLRREG